MDDNLDLTLNTLWDRALSTGFRVHGLSLTLQRLSDEIPNFKYLTKALLQKANAVPLKDRPKRIYVEFSYNSQISISGLLHFIKFLSFCQVEYLNLKVDPLLSCDKNLLIFASNLHRVPSLDALSLSGWGPECEDLNVSPLLFRILHSEPTCHVRYLSVGIDRMAEDTGYAAELGNALMHAKTLEELTLECNTNIDDQEITTLFGRLQECSSKLRDFQLMSNERGFYFSLKALAEFLHRQSSLRSFTVWSPGDLPVESFEPLIGPIKTHPSLKDVSLRFKGDEQCHLTNDLLRHMMGGTSGWQSLSLDSIELNRMKDKEMFKLSTSHFCNMDMNIIFNGIDISRIAKLELGPEDEPEKAMCLLPLFANPSCHVFELDFKTDVEVWNSICVGLQNYAHLTKLCFGCTEPVSYPFHNLQTKSNLQDISLDMHTTSENWNNLGVLLGHQSTLKHLCVGAYGHQLEAHAMTAFRDSVRDHAYLKTLHIRRYSLTACESQPIVEQILAGLEPNSTLECLIFDDCFNWAVSFSQLLAFLQRNKKLTKFSTCSPSGEDPNALSEGQLTQLATALQENSSLRFFGDTSGGSQSWTYSNEMHVKIMRALYRNWVKDVPLSLMHRLLFLAKQDTSRFVLLHETVEFLVQAYRHSFNGKVRRWQPFLLDDEWEDCCVGQQKKSRTS